MTVELPGRGDGNLITGNRHRDYVVEAIRSYYDAWRANKEYAEALDPYLRGEHPLPIADESRATGDLQELKKLAQTPYGVLIMNSCTQTMKMTGLKSGDSEEVLPIFNTLWRANRYKARQAQVIRAAVGYGQAYTIVMPGRVGIEGEESVRWDNRSPKRMTGFYMDDDDEYPVIALDGVEQQDSLGPYILMALWDDRYVHWAIVRDYNQVDPAKLHVEYISSEGHPSDVTPIVRHVPIMDADGQSPGELTPFLPLIGRIDQGIYDRMVIQRYASWRVRYAAGLKKPSNAEDAKRQREVLAGDMLVFENSDIKVGTLEASSIAEHITAHEADKKTLAATSQTPPYMLMGETSNMSPEGLGAISSGWRNKIDQYRDSIGTSHEQQFVLSAHVMPSLGEVPEGAEVRWKGFRPYSLTQTADALGKLAQQLEIDPSILWEWVPDLTEENIRAAQRRREEARAEEMAIAAAGAAAQNQAQAQRNREAGVAADSNQNRVN